VRPIVIREPPEITHYFKCLAAGLTVIKALFAVHSLESCLVTVGLSYVLVYAELLLTIISLLCGLP
jgi:hypothetical protein